MPEAVQAESNDGITGAPQDDSAAAKQDTLSRRHFLGALGGAIAAGSLAAAGLRTPGARAAATDAPRAAFANGQPNILFIINDQERFPQHFPPGWVEANLPARQRLAANGLSFRRHFCSTAMCSPSRSTLFTGTHPAQHGVIHTLTEYGTYSDREPTLSTHFQTLGKMMGAAGYNVVFKGKWHMSKGDDGHDPSPAQVAAHGFDDWEPTSVANDIKVRNFGGGCANWDEQVADQALDFLATQTAATTAAEPFMLVVGLGNPHDVLSYPNSWNTTTQFTDCESPDNYTGFDFDQGVGLPVSLLESLATKPTCQAQIVAVANAALGELVTPASKLNYTNFYAGLIKLVDEQIGRVLDGIPEEIRDDTIVIFTSDHGEMGMAHGGMRQKAFQMYEETVNVPLIIHNPVLFPTGQTTDAYAALIDLMPTLATLAQVPNRDDYLFMGTDLSPLLAAPDNPVQNEILFTFDDIWAARADGPFIDPITGGEVPGAPKNIRAIFTQDADGEWKYARYFDPESFYPPQFEMYQLRTGLGLPVDPFELNNLANEASPNYSEPAIVAKRAQLAARLRALEEERLQPLPGSELFLPIVRQD